MEPPLTIRQKLAGMEILRRCAPVIGHFVTRDAESAAAARMAAVDLMLSAMMTEHGEVFRTQEEAWQLSAIVRAACEKMVATHLQLRKDADRAAQQN